MKICCSSAAAVIGSQASFDVVPDPGTVSEHSLIYTLRRCDRKKRLFDSFSFLSIISFVQMFQLFYSWSSGETGVPFLLYRREDNEFLHKLYFVLFFFFSRDSSICGKIFFRYFNILDQHFPSQNVFITTSFSTTSTEIHTESRFNLKPAAAENIDNL